MNKNFKKIVLQNKSLFIISFLLISIFLISIYSPYITSDIPLLIKYENKSIEFPLISRILDKNFFESGIDIFFNLLSLELPIFLLIFLLGIYFFKNKLRYLIFLFLIIHISIFLYLEVSPKRFPYVDYKKLVKEDKNITFVINTPFNYSYREMDFSENNPAPPSLKHILGTDTQGRDIFARMLFGSRVSLTTGLGAVSFYILIGVILGSISGFYGGWIDIIISRLIEVTHSFPPIFVILTFSVFMEHGNIFYIIFIIAITSWPLTARLVRNKFLIQKQKNYVRASLSLGMSDFYIIFSEILPNSLGPIMVSATLGVASSILIEATLSFLGLGDPTMPAWGTMLNNGRIEQKLWMILPAGISILTLITLFNLLGEELKENFSKSKVWEEQ